MNNASTWGRESSEDLWTRVFFAKLCIIAALLLFACNQRDDGRSDELPNPITPNEVAR
jgi:hypothetical protein